MVSTSHSILRGWSADMSQALRLGCDDRGGVLALDERRGLRLERWRKLEARSLFVFKREVVL